MDCLDGVANVVVLNLGYAAGISCDHWTDVKVSFVIIIDIGYGCHVDLEQAESSDDIPLYSAIKSKGVEYSRDFVFQRPAISRSYLQLDMLASSDTISFSLCSKAGLDNDQ